jgi:hypothetical protein
MLARGEHPALAPVPLPVPPSDARGFGRSSSAALLRSSVHVGIQHRTQLLLSPRRLRPRMGQAKEIGSRYSVKEPEVTVHYDGAREPVKSRIKRMLSVRV